MKNAQIISLTGPEKDAVIIFGGDSVIDNTDQLPLGTGHSKTTIQVDIDLFDITTGLAVTTIANAEMLYQASSDQWSILISGEGTPNDISDTLADRHKYVGQITENAPTHNMRKFKIADFAVDSDSFEAVWMRYPYEVVVSPPNAWIRWYAPGDIGGTVLFEAPAYQNGTGTVSATAPNRVTHRGAVVPVP